MYIDALNDLEVLRDHYREELRVRLDEKVKRQRQERDKRKKLAQAADNEMQQQV